MKKLIVFPFDSHHLCLPVIIYGPLFLIELLLVANIVLSFEITKSPPSMFLGAGSFIILSSSKYSISCQWINSLDHLKSLIKNSFYFSDPTQAYLSLAGFSKMLQLKISLKGYSIKVSAQLPGPVIMKVLFLPLS